MLIIAGLRSRSRLEPKLLAGAGAGAGILKFRLQLPAPAPGQTKVVYLIIIHIEQDQKIELSQYSFQKVMKNQLFHLKAVKTGTLKAQVEAGAGNFLKVGAGAGAGAEKNSFGSATLDKRKGPGTVRSSYQTQDPDLFQNVSDLEPCYEEMN